MKSGRREFLKQAAVGVEALALMTLETKLQAEAGAAATPPFKKGAAFIDTSGEEAFIAGYPLSWWTRAYGLPLHVTYAPIIRENLRGFRKVFEALYPNGHIRYAGKACAHPAVFKIVLEEGAGIDVASENETRCALKAGAPPEKLDLNGNCKEDALIEEGVAKGMLIIADSAEELALTETIAKRVGKRPRAVLRVSGFDLGNVTGEAIFTAGRWCKFGAAVETVPELLKSLDRFPSVELVGFHTHIGSQIADVEPYLVVLGKMLELGHALRAAGKRCEIVNLGGGYPVSYVDEAAWEGFLRKVREGIESAAKGDPSRVHVWNNDHAGFAMGRDGSPDFGVWADEKFFAKHPKSRMLEAILKGDVKVNGRTVDAVKALHELGSPSLIIEPGRSIVSDAGVTLAKVAHVRQVAGRHDLVTVEMGVTSHGVALVSKTINRWAVTGDFHRRDPQPFEAFVAGNLCFSGDMLSRYKVPLQRKPKRGEALMIHDTGAYDSHFFAANANSFPRPARILADQDGRLSVLRSRDTFEEVFSTR